MRNYFGGLYGNAAARTSLGEAIECGTLPHALLLEGGAGSGKFTFAKEIAAALCCEHRTDTAYPLPCRSCNLCRKVLSDDAVDVTVLSREGKATVGVDAIRQIKQDMALSATEADARVYILRDGECMTPAAQNALLVALEEPPPNVYLLLLCTQADEMLETVRSRTRLVRMETFSAAGLDTYLTGSDERACTRKAADPDKYYALLQSSHGRIGEARTLLDTEGGEKMLQKRAVVDGLLRCLPGTPQAALLWEAFSALPATRLELAEELSLFLFALRDLLAVRRAAQAPLCYFTEKAAAAALSAKIPQGRLCRLSDEVTDALSALDQNANVAVLLARLKEAVRYGG